MHSDRKTSENKLIATVSEITENGGKVLIPAFAIGRAQEVLTILKQAISNKKLPPVPVYVDGMVRQVCNIYGDHPRYTTPYIAKQSRRGHAFYNKHIVSVLQKDRKDIISGDPCIIVSSSGMLSGGPSAFYAEKLGKEEKNAIVITGYQDEESPGRALLNLLDSDKKEKIIKINGNDTSIACQIKSYSLSAHADRLQIVSLIDRLRPKTVVLVHGDEAAKNSLALSLGGLDVIHAQEGMGLKRQYPKRASNYKKSGFYLNRSMLTSLAEANQDPVSIETLAVQVCQKKVQAKYFPDLKDLILQTGLFIEGEEPGTLLSTKIKFTGKKKVKGKKGAEKVVNLSKEEHDLLALNPKSQLLELCSKAQVGHPKFEREDRDEDHITSASMEIDGKLYKTLNYTHTKLMLSIQQSYHDLLRQCQDILKSRAETRTKVFVSGRHPKSVLNEICQKHGISLPLTKERIEGGSKFGIQCFIKTADNIFESEFHYASSKKTAEKLAFEELLQIVMKDLPKEPSATQVNSKQDFKSALFVLCAQNQMKTPDFHIRRSEAGFIASGEMEISGETVSSKNHQCINHKAGHQMVSEELLSILNRKNDQAAGGGTTIAGNQST
jgi:hypothetical protein